MEILGTEAPSAIAKATGLSRQTVYRIKDDPVQAEATLRAWEARPQRAAVTTGKAPPGAFLMPRPCYSGAMMTHATDDYDPTDDVWKSVAEAYRIIRERMAAGGPG
jgi:hypothetical protein